MTQTFSRKEKLARRMDSYYKNNSAYHTDIEDIAGQRPSTEEKELFREISQYQNAKNKSLKVLEIGCGSCDSAANLLSRLDSQEYYGIDPSPYAINSARQKYPNYNLFIGDASYLDFEDNYFDVVIFNFVLEHTVYPDQVLSEAIRVSKPGGLLGMIVPVSDLPWLLPNSLRHKRKNLPFLIPFTIVRWLEFLKLRYQKKYYSFRVIEEPIALQETDNYEFQTDDDLVYLGSSFEIIKYLTNSGCQLLFKKGRDIRSCIVSGKKLIIDLSKQLAFACLKLSLLNFKTASYTTTISIVARKREKQ